MRVLLMMIFLTGLIACTTKTEYRYIRPVIPEPPPQPAYSDVTWKKLELDSGPHYCLDRKNTRAFLINQELQKAYVKKLEQILRELRDRYGGHAGDS